MATPNATGDDIRAGASASNGAAPETSTSLQDSSPRASAETPIGEWLDLASFFCAGVCGIGTLIMLSSLLFASDDSIWPLLVGGGLVSLAGLGWGTLGLAMIVSITKRWLNGPGKARKSPSSAIPE